MRIIKDLSRTDRNIILCVVNEPPPNITKHNEAAAKKRESLFDKISEGIITEKFTIDFTKIEEITDLKLLETEWELLKLLFEDPGWPTMLDRRTGKIVHSKVMKADYIEDKNDS